MRRSTQARDIAIVIGIVLVVLLLLGLVAGGWMMGPGMMWPGGFGFFPWWGVLMMIFWLFIVGGVVLLVIWLLQQGRPVGAGPRPESRPLEILRERYARGEITREQYEQMRHDLEQS